MMRQQTGGDSERGPPIPGSNGAVDASLSPAQVREGASRASSYRSGQQRLLVLLMVCLLLMLGGFPALLLQVESRQTPASALTPGAESTYTYLDGLSWSIFSASAFGRGAAPPQTRAGRALAGLATANKLLTLGVTAELIRTTLNLHEIGRMPLGRLSGTRLARQRGREEDDSVYVVEGLVVRFPEQPRQEVAASLVDMMRALPAPEHGPGHPGPWSSSSLDEQVGQTRPDPLVQRRLLEEEIARRRAEGWKVLNRTSDSVHFRRHTGWGHLTLALLVALTLGAVAAVLPSATALARYLLLLSGAVRVLLALHAWRWPREQALVTLSDLERREQTIPEPDS